MECMELTGYTPEIRIYINSDGGDLHCGFQLMNILEKSRVKVTTIAQGTCASAQLSSFSVALIDGFRRMRRF